MISKISPSSSILALDLKVFGLTLEVFYEEIFSFKYLVTERIQSVVFVGIIEDEFEYIKNLVSNSFQILFNCLQGIVFEKEMIEVPVKLSNFLGRFLESIPNHLKYLKLVDLVVEALSNLLRCSSIDLRELDF